MEKQQEQAAEAEDYEQADLLQTQIDNIQQVKIPELKEELLAAEE